MQAGFLLVNNLDSLHDENPFGKELSMILLCFQAAHLFHFWLC